MASNEERQVFLDKSIKQPIINKLNLLNWNIGNPSLERASKQVKWIEENNFDILVLTESKPSKGCLLINDRLKYLGYDVYFPKIKRDNYGVIIAVKKQIKNDIHNISLDILPHRAPSVKCQFLNKNLIITGVYIPPTNSENREIFYKELNKFLSNKKTKENFKEWIILGDLNIPRPDLIISKSTDRYNTTISREIYKSFINNDLVDAHFHANKNDFSIEKEGKRYRPDNIFVSRNLIKDVSNCFYIHQPRQKGLSDHSPMVLSIF